MMLGVNVSAICITTVGLIITGDLPIVAEFLRANPLVFRYNIITAITSASGQLCIFYTIKEFGPIVFTIIMTTRQMISICISALVFGHPISINALLGAAVVFFVIFYQIRRKYDARLSKKATGNWAQDFVYNRASFFDEMMLRDVARACCIYGRFQRSISLRLPIAKCGSFLLYLRDSRILSALRQALRAWMECSWWGKDRTNSKFVSSHWMPSRLPLGF